MSNSQLTKFDKRIQSLPQDVVLMVAKIDKLQGQWIAGAKLNPQALGRLKRSVLITSTGASTRIEGSSLSDEEIEKLMKGLTAQKMKDRDAQEVRGYYDLLSFIFENHQDVHFSENIVKQFHSALLQYSTKDIRHRGQYKALENRVEATDTDGNVVETIFETTPMHLTAKEMQELCVWFMENSSNSSYHPLLTVSCFIVDFLKIHPFLDGNGRLSRLLTNLLLLQAGYEYVPYVSHEKLIEDSKSDYYIALRRSQKTFNTDVESIEEWTRFFLELFRKQTERALELLSDESIDKLLSPNQLIVWEYISNNISTSIKDIEENTEVARPTIRQAIERLLKLKKIERLGQGRTTRYRKINNEKERI